MLTHMTYKQKNWFKFLFNITIIILAVSSTSPLQFSLDFANFKNNYIFYFLWKSKAIMKCVKKLNTGNYPASSSILFYDKLSYKISMIWKLQYPAKDTNYLYACEQLHMSCNIAILRTKWRKQYTILKTQDLNFLINFANAILATWILIFNINTVVSNCNMLGFKTLSKVSSFRKAILFKVILLLTFSAQRNTRVLKCTAYIHTNTSSLVYECTQHVHNYIT